MADAYGATRSNWAKIKPGAEATAKDAIAALKFGGTEVEFCEVSDDGKLAFGGYGQYPSAYPLAMDDSGDEDPEMRAEVIERLAACLEEPLVVMAVSNEKLRYVVADRWALWPDGTEFSQSLTESDVPAKPEAGA